MSEPIKLTYNTINEKVDDLVYRAVTEVGIEIDKDALIKALEKQQPQKPTEEDGWLWCCPVCKLHLEKDTSIHYCEHCGQAILWDED